MYDFPSQKRKYGLKKVKPKYRDLVRGSKRRLAGIPLQPDGQWDAYLPPDEVQNLAMEPMACVTFALLNCVEILERRIFGTTTNWSDRFLAKLSKTTRRGNDPHKVAETLRDKGCVYESDLPYTTEIDTWEKFYAPIPFQLEVDAQVKFKGKYKFGHQWVRPDASSMMAALTCSPLTVGVYAWTFDPKTGYAIRPTGFDSTHDTVIYGYVLNKYWKCLDTYDMTHKKVEWNFGFEMLKEYTLDKKILDDTLWGRAIKWLRNFI